jgi:predicted ribosomally synthesized peptide with SipW-like signal peptide
VNKLVILLLAVLAALGSLGAAYAMWSDDIVVNGTITTGRVDINVVPDFEETYVWKTTAQGILLTNSDIPPYSEGNPSAIAVDAFPGVDKNRDGYDIDPVAFATVMENGEDAVQITFNNLFPLDLVDELGLGVGFKLKYEGTIPVRITTKWSIVPQGESMAVPDWATELMNNHAAITMTDPETGNAIDKNSWQDIHLYPGDTVNVRVGIDIPRSINGVASQPILSGKSFQLAAKIGVYQWNESAPALP